MITTALERKMLLSQKIIGEKKGGRSKARKTGRKGKMKERKIRGRGI